MAGIRSREQIGFCRRVGTSLRSGVDMRRIWQFEAQQGSQRYRAAMATIGDEVQQGESLTAALRATEFFPPVTVAMVEIGEHTGKIDEALLRLADHYEHQADLQRQFLFGIAWPALNLLVAILVVGLLIYVFGAIGNTSVDITGLGLAGGRGAAIYFLAVGAIAAGFAAAIMAIAKGWLGPAPVRFAMRLPLLGPALQHTAMCRLAWSLGMALDAGMNAKRSAELAILSTQNPYYLARTPMVLATLSRNDPFYQAFRDADGFPPDFLRELENAEIAGTLSESLVRMAREYNERARTALRAVTFVAMGGVWVGIASIMIALIFRLFLKAYMGPIWEAQEMLK
jgi:type IV pilus assembly protein PilC